MSVDLGLSSRPREWALVEEDAVALTVPLDRAGVLLHAGVVLGSGFASAFAQVQEGFPPLEPDLNAALFLADTPVPKLPLSAFSIVLPPHLLAHVPAPSVAGHGAAMLVLVDPVSAGRSRSASLLVAGRSHLYEGLAPSEVVHLVRVLARAGAGALLLTNAAGSVDPALVPGSLVLIRDHLNLTGVSPLTGAVGAWGGPRFPDMSQVYHPQLREALAAAVESASGRPARSGVYAQLSGPAYETPAEVVMVSRLGGDLVGMSTALEAMAAVHAGMSVVGLSLVTNLAAGLASEALDHAEVVAAGAAAQEQLRSVLTAMLAPLGALGAARSALWSALGPPQL